MSPINSLLKKKKTMHIIIVSVCLLIVKQCFFKVLVVIAPYLHSCFLFHVPTP